MRGRWQMAFYFLIVLRPLLLILVELHSLDCRQAVESHIRTFYNYCFRYLTENTAATMAIVMTAAASLPARLAGRSLPCRTVYRGMASGFLVNHPKYQFLKVNHSRWKKLYCYSVHFRILELRSRIVEYLMESGKGPGR